MSVRFYRMPRLMVLTPMDGGSSDDGVQPSRLRYSHAFLAVPLRVAFAGGGTIARMLSDTACVTPAVGAMQASLPAAATISADVQTCRLMAVIPVRPAATPYRQRDHETTRDNVGSKPRCVRAVAVDPRRNQGPDTEDNVNTAESDPSLMRKGAQGGADHNQYSDNEIVPGHVGGGGGGNGVKERRYDQPDAKQYVDFACERYLWAAVLARHDNHSSSS